jgi:ribosomal protein L30/L7E
LTLTHEERHSALWLKLKEHIAEQIDMLRRRNDGDFDAVTTASIRGQIRALKNLVALETDPPTVADD